MHGTLRQPVTSGQHSPETSSPPQQQRAFSCLRRTDLRSRAQRRHCRLHQANTPDAKAQQLCQNAFLGMLAGASSLILATPAALADTASWEQVVDPPALKVLDFDHAVPRSSDVVQYIVKTFDDDKPMTSLSVNGRNWGFSTATDMAAAITLGPARFWNWYNSELDMHPLATKIVTGVVGTVLGDTLAQYSSARLSTSSAATRLRPSVDGSERMDQSLEKPLFIYDVQRCLRLLAYSAVIGTPMCHVWFNFLDSVVYPGAPTSTIAVASKVAMDQLLMAPVGTALFFAVMKLLEGAPQAVPQALKTCYLPTLRASYMVWPLAHIINFALVPPSQRILYVNCIAILWTAYMSYMTSQPTTDAAETVGTQVPEASGNLPAAGPNRRSSVRASMQRFAQRQ